MSGIAADPLEEGRLAIAQSAWPDAYRLLKQADEDGTLGPHDVELLAQAALWNSRFEESNAYLERAYRAHLDAGTRAEAAVVAVELAHNFATQLQPAIASGWMGRAKRLLEEEPEGPAHGYWALEESLRAVNRREGEAALELAKRAEEIGRAHGDRNLEVRALQRRGGILIARGDAEEGKQLLDEASAAAVGGELDPYSTVVVYCNTIGACRDVADFDRAGEWTELAQAFCHENSMGAFPGMCRVNYAEVMKFKGRLPEALEQAGRAGEELRDWCPRIAGAAFYELGEVRLRMGELEEAERAFREADEYGKDPEPGVSLLRLAQGNAKGAWATIRRALAEEGLAVTHRARLAPAGVEIALAVGETAPAEELAEELADAARVYETSALKAAAAYARGQLRVARGDAAAAYGCFREARRLWDATGATYDVARAREQLGRLAREEGDEETAVWELQAAAARFERVGATRDADRVAELLKREPEQVTKTFLFTDIVKSTDLLSTIEDRHWANALRLHDDALRAIFADHRGQVVDHTGDGFFVAFDDTAEAIQAAIALQRAVDQEFVFDVRVGVHTDGALRQGMNYHGRGVHTAARVGAAAEGREILATRESIPDSGEIRVGNPRRVALKGLKEPVEVVSIDWR